MHFDEFQRRLDEAAHAVRSFAIHLVPQQLPSRFR